jgi:aspartyl-tRNA(Asn)/glutamyl-tRNA(Gln) amidotransferase subunit C
MTLTLKDVDHIAQLARLQLSQEEKEKYLDQLSSILSHISQLSELDTSNIPPMTSVLAEFMETRDDVAKESLSIENLMSNAPQKSLNQFVVPPVFDENESHE